MPTYTYPTNHELVTIGPEKVARKTETRVGFQIMPLRSVNASTIVWEQRDNFYGLQQLRGLDGAPNQVKRVGRNRYSYEPGVYGEYETIGETELTQRSQGADDNTPVDVTDLVMEAQDQMIVRELDLIEYIIWKLLVEGTFSISLPNGTTGYSGTFSIQTYSGSDWSDSANATPMADFRAVQLLGDGKGVNFGAGATAYMNRKTANRMLNNTNDNDLHGRFKNSMNPIQNVAVINQIASAEDLPTTQIYNEGYYNDSNTFTKFIPDDKVVVVGQRTDGERVGEYRLTRNMMNPSGAPGSYDFVVDQTGNAPDGQKHVPPKIDVHRGHNGGPVIYFPSAIVVMSV